RRPGLRHRGPPPHRAGPRRRSPRPGLDGLPAARRRRSVALPVPLLRHGPRRAAPGHHPLREPRMSPQTTDVLVIGSGFGGAIPAYHLAAAGARVTVLERGPRLATEDFTHDLNLGAYPRIVDVIKGDGVSVVAGNCVGGGSVVYFAASLRAPS